MTCPKRKRCLVYQEFIPHRLTFLTHDDIPNSKVLDRLSEGFKQEYMVTTLTATVESSLVTVSFTPGFLPTVILPSKST